MGIKKILFGNRPKIVIDKSTGTPVIEGGRPISPQTANVLSTVAQVGIGAAAGLTVGAVGAALTAGAAGANMGGIKGVTGAALSAAGTAASSQLVQAGNQIGKGLFSGLSGGLSFGKNQNLVWVPFAIIIGLVLIFVVRPFGLFTGRKRR